jgi:hypothetical protein
MRNPANPYWKECPDNKVSLLPSVKIFLEFWTMQEGYGEALEIL